MYAYRLVFGTLLVICLLATVVSFMNEVWEVAVLAFASAVLSLFAVAVCDGIDRIEKAIRDQE